MGRNPNHQQPSARSTKAQANELLNFHFSTPASSRQDSLHNNNNNNNNNRNDRRCNNGQQNSRRNNDNNNNNNRRLRSKQCRASVRCNADSSMFYLHSSSEHTFILSRLSPSKISKTDYSFHGSNKSVSWQSVRAVNHRVPQYQHHKNTSYDCPICLCDFVCPRISKCGHSFCLSCVLRHVKTYAANNPYNPVKCPCCGIPFIVEDLRPVMIESLQPVKLNESLRLRKLHRRKESSSPFLPIKDAEQHSNPHFAPIHGIDADAKFSRFNYVDPDTYRNLLVANQEELLEEMKIAIGSNDKFDVVERIYLSMALDIVLEELKKAEEELPEEKKLIERFATLSSGMYQKQSPALLFEGGKVENGGIDFDHIDIVTTKIGKHPEEKDRRTHHGVDKKPTDNTLRGENNYKTRLKGSMFLDTSSAIHFYQAEDGQLIFLNGFNMNCLLSDFSKSPACVNEQKYEDQARLPFPDYIEGRVLEIENLHLTSDSRKRFPFLNHVPLYTDIVFVEIELNDTLSDVTKLKFRGDFVARRKRRRSKVLAEKRADRSAKKEEQQLVKERKARLQIIDPDDDFFQVSIEPESPNAIDPMQFLEPLPGGCNFNQHNTTTLLGSIPVSSFNFSEACRRGNDRIALSSGEAFPALSSSEEFPSLCNKESENHVQVNPQLVNDLATVHVSSVAGEKKKKKGNKLVLFSTGGVRGR